MTQCMLQKTCLACLLLVVAGCGPGDSVGDVLDRGGETQPTYSIEHKVSESAVASGSTVEIVMGPMAGNFEGDPTPFQPRFVVESVESTNEQVLLPVRDFYPHEKHTQDVYLEAKSPGNTQVTVAVNGDGATLLSKKIDLNVAETARAVLDFGCPKTVETPLVITDGGPLHARFRAYDADDVELQGDLSAHLNAQTAAGDPLEISGHWERSPRHAYFVYHPQPPAQLTFSSQRFNLSKDVSVREGTEVDALRVSETWRNERGPGEFRKIEVDVSLEIAGQPVCHQPPGFAYGVEASVLTPQLCQLIDRDEQVTRATTQYGTFSLRSTSDTTQGTCRVEFTHIGRSDRQGVSATYEFEL